MGCNSDYMNPNATEANSQMVAGHLVYLLPRLGKPVPHHVQKAADSQYGDTTRLDDHTALLCNVCGALTKKQSDGFIYNGRSKEARALAEWWDEHQAADKERLAAERAEKRNNATFKRVWGVLSPSEKRAITDHFGVSDD